jgi:hypothetical protein
MASTKILVESIFIGPNGPDNPCRRTGQHGSVRIISGSNDGICADYTSIAKMDIWKDNGADAQEAVVSDYYGGGFAIESGPDLRVLADADKWMPSIHNRTSGRDGAAPADFHEMAANDVDVLFEVAVVANNH